MEAGGWVRVPLGNDLVAVSDYRAKCLTVSAALSLKKIFYS